MYKHLLKLQKKYFQDWLKLLSLAWARFCYVIHDAWLVLRQKEVLLGTKNRADPNQWLFRGHPLLLAGSDGCEDLDVNIGVLARLMG